MTGRAAAADAWIRYRRTARQDGLVPALTLLCETDGGPPRGPGGHMVVPAGVAGADAGDVVTTLTVEDGTVVVLRSRAEPPGGSTPWAAWALGVTCLRFGLSERLLDAVLAHLGGRTVGDAKLLHQQMVKGGVAEAVIEQLEIETMLAGATPGDLDGGTLAGLNAQITGTDRMLLRLLGAVSFLVDGPGQVARVSELIADVHFGSAGTGEYGGAA
ncbi:hypothetical protein AQJ46_32535 [Streptomyces canus]|uniref:Acyl-CoA dehydrogenase/oxidase C-terminal domain-containing protein n=1 Tax=Streptomyces canus TaxID=58343 RepID=A0A101RUN4_9ACTN|nr:MULTISPECIES: hypothetical protein [Streptomyces]KUN62057.1 hypothetical protein AQJ46_32535 [Streptomyces canus]MDI5904299.1 hypothetical protein [Streptomyces sp. 12257]